MSEARWLPLNADEIAPSRHPSDAKWVEESPSPYDVPTHARSFYDEQTGCLTIEFRYMSNEITKKIDLGSYVVATVGKLSRRIYAIQLNVESFNRDKAKMAAATASFISQSSGLRPTNRRVASMAVERKQGSLFAAAGL